MNNSWLLQDLWVYDLSGNEITKRDVNEAHKLNLIVRKMFDECYLIGSWNGIMSWLYDYVGVEMVTEYMRPLKEVL